MKLSYIQRRIMNDSRLPVYICLIWFNKIDFFSYRFFHEKNGGSLKKYRKTVASKETVITFLPTMGDAWPLSPKKNLYNSCYLILSLDLRGVSLTHSTLLLYYIYVQSCFWEYFHVSEYTLLRLHVSWLYNIHTSIKIK